MKARRGARGLGFACVAVAWVIVGTPPICAQSATATLSGTAVDETGAVIPEADITVLHVATRLKRENSSSYEGYFTFPLLAPGRYTVTAQRQGFTPAEIRDLVLNVND